MSEIKQNSINTLKNSGVKKKKNNKMVESIADLNLPRPDEIKNYLDQYVIGQDDAKRTLSVAVYNHYKRIIYNLMVTNEKDKINIDKSNCIIYGPTGGGKSFLLRKVAELLGVPCVICDSSRFTAAGYVGEDVENCLVSVLRACDYNIEQAELAIVCLDEIDKLAKKNAGPSITRDVSGEGVQQCLLKLVEGDTVAVPPAGGRKHPEQQFLYIDTTNILFIGMGAFPDLDSVIKRRMGHNTIGFGADKVELKENESYLQYATPQDFRDFGFIPEFIGRFPILTNIEKLTIEDLYCILKEPKNSLVKQYTQLMSMDGMNLTFEDDALMEIAKLAYNLGTGARALRSIVEGVMEDIMFDAPKLVSEGKNEIVITKDDVLKKTVKFKNLRKAA